MHSGNSALPKNGVKKQKRKNKKQSTIMSTPSPLTNSRLKTFTITDQELNNIGTATPMKPKVLHDNEVICTTQTGENSFITICTLDGKLVTLSVHLLMKKQQTCSSENDIVSNAESLLSIDSITGENRGMFINFKSLIIQEWYKIECFFSFFTIRINSLYSSICIQGGFLI